MTHLRTVSTAQFRFNQLPSNRIGHQIGDERFGCSKNAVVHDRLAQDFGGEKTHPEQQNQGIHEPKRGTANMPRNQCNNTNRHERIFRR